MSITLPSDLPTGTVVSFDTFAPAILGTEFKDCTVMCHLDAETVRLLGFDPAARHANIYPSLPTGQVPNDHTAYLYVKLRTINGATEYVGLPWIRKETVRARQVRTATLVFEDVGPEDVQEIIEQVSAAGYRPAKVDIN